jgi:glucokinase
MDARVLAFDVGGTSTKIGLLAPDGSISHFRRISTDASGHDPMPFVSRLLAELDALLTATSPFQLLGIGGSLHGEIDQARRGSVIAGNTPALRGFDMRGALEARFDLPVTLHNDLTAHGLGEFYFGVGRGVKRFMCVAVGTGLGAVVLVDGAPLITQGGNSGNTGLIILDPDGPLDSNGIRGSAEALCGVPGIERLAAAHYGTPTPAHEVIARARDGGDPVAAAIMTQIGGWLGQMIASLSVIYYPHRVALTGGTSAAGAVLLEACRAGFDRLVGAFFRDLAQNTAGQFQDVEIVLGEGGAETALKGAAVELFQGHGLL